MQVVPKPNNVPPALGSVGPERRRPACKGCVEKGTAPQTGKVGRKGSRSPRRVWCPRSPGISVQKEAWQLREHCGGRKDMD